MQPNRELLKDKLEAYEDKVKSLDSYLTELRTMCTKHDTPNEACASEWGEATHNLFYYKGEVARIKQELGTKSRLASMIPGIGTAVGARTLLPETRNQGIGVVVLSSISFVVGAILGSVLTSAKSKD